MDKTETKLLLALADGNSAEIVKQRDNLLREQGLPTYGDAYVEYGRKRQEGANV